ncbi:Fungalysin/Thermolysin Extracellular metalloproteinase 5, partial [Ceratobasidium sp. UAMH 11750]
MKSLRAAALLSVAFLASATAHSTRKSLGFGPRHPAARFVTEPQIASSFAAHTDPLDVARAFLQAYTDSDYFIREDSYTDKNTGITHVYVRQRVDGLEVADGDMNLNIRDGRVLSFGDSFFRGSAPAALGARPTSSHATHCADFAGERMAVAGGDPQFVLSELSTAHEDVFAHNCARPLAAVQEAATADSRKDTHDPRRAALYFMIAAHPDSSAVAQLTRDFDATLDHMTVGYEHHLADSHPTAVITGLPGAVNPVKARVVYIQTPTEDNKTQLHATWRLEVEMADNWYEAYVSAADPSTIVSVVDWASDSPMPRSGGKLNALEAKLATGQPVQAKGAGSYKYGAKTGKEKDPKEYIDLAVTQLFYTSNMVHDLYYRYGFDELAGNFQQDNYGRGGRDGDAVIANAQDGSGYNNANFMTPPDGQNGRCRMYIWNTATPYRDGDLEAGIVIHELSHGLSTRLTGGPANSGCLGWGESGGMGEGWGDFLATTIRSTQDYSDFSMGSWASNQPNGIRNYVYSTNMTVNPSTYKTLDKPGYWGVHAIGEVWAEILWVVSQKMIEKHGYSTTLFPPQPLEDGTIPTGDFYRPQTMGEPLVPKHGNTLMVQLVISAMKLQPCRPSFFDARDAIIEADKHLTGGENFCTLWAAFGSRGLGKDASLRG